MGTQTVPTVVIIYMVVMVTVNVVVGWWQNR